MPVQPARQSLPLVSSMVRVSHSAALASILASSLSLMIASPAVGGTASLLMALIGPVSLSRCSVRITPPCRGGSA